MTIANWLAGTFGRTSRMPKRTVSERLVLDASRLWIAALCSCVVLYFKGLVDGRSLVTQTPPIVAISGFVVLLIVLGWLLWSWVLLLRTVQEVKEELVSHGSISTTEAQRIEMVIVQPTDRHMN